MTTSPINNYNSLLAAQMYPASNNPFKGKGDVGKNPRVPGEGAQVQGAKGYAPAGAAQELNEVSNIGFAKKAGFENGLGGTNHPVDANGRVCRTWVA